MISQNSSVTHFRIDPPKKGVRDGSSSFRELRTAAESDRAPLEDQLRDVLTIGDSNKEFQFELFHCIHCNCFILVKNTVRAKIVHTIPREFHGLSEHSFTLPCFSRNNFLTLS